MNTDPIEAFLEELQSRGRHPVTVAEYATNLREFVQYLACTDTSPFAADESIILHYVAGCSRRGLAKKTVWKKHYAVHALYEWPTEQGYLLLNPCPKPVFTGEQPLPREVTTWRDLGSIYGERGLRESRNTWEQRDFVMIDLAYCCGLGRCELHNLDTTDIDEREGTVQVRGKGGRRRVVPIGPRALRDLRYYLYHIRPKLCKNSTTKAVFVSWREGGKRMHLYSINAVFRRLKKRGYLEKGITPHRLRHGFATDLIRNGAPVQDVSRMLGHKKLETTQIYTRLYPADLKAHHKCCHPRG